jgi:hypothetical protein
MVTPEQTCLFLDQATGHWLYAAFHLIAFTGLRCGEACGAAPNVASQVPHRVVGEVPSSTGRVPNGSPRSRRMDWFSGDSANGQVRPI